MIVVCIDTNFTKWPIKKCILEYGKVYEASFVLFNEDSSPVEWNNNFLELEGFSEIDWFPTKNFVTLEVWREKILSEIGI